MNIYIVDASVAAKWFIDEEHTDAAVSLLHKNNQLHAPDFLLLEMDSIICKWIRRKIITDSEGEQIRANIRRIPIQLHPMITLLDAAFSIANQTEQSVYDCLYMALAVLLNGQMVTADKRLQNALVHGPLEKHLSWIGNLQWKSQN